ncbi:PAS domain-containing sensor histidine kinase [Mucilaginibacter corticis]|uniref:histidine kinase n=1 Tax=Mucilaginibacter corticis TaxID=2597670 RepID=A0A556MX15_9SPHI|nr:ATP-binding protein [Mucilaginibacter corticis]TSJ44461.1 PAS domain-containing sensor histidine kinase [Mucilaginibacter corticis]
MITFKNDQISFKAEQHEASSINNRSLHIIKTDLQGHFTYLNRLFCETTGILESNYIGKHYLELVLTEDRALCSKVFEECLKDPERVHTARLGKHTPLGIAYTQWEFISLVDEMGNLKEVLCMGHDVTSLILRQETLENLVANTSRQNERLTEFTYIVSHNIRSHVANLSGIIDGIDQNDREDVSYSLELLKLSINALDSTIHYLNDIITIQAEKSLPLEKINLLREATKVCKLLQLPLAEAGAELRMQISETVILLTNPAYLESILLNLLTNALKYRDPARQLVIEMSLVIEGDCQVLRVKDNGLGIDLRRHGDRLFKMFGKFHGNDDARGVGLFIVKTQVEALGGEITVESEPGKGSIFNVCFKIGE